MPDTASVNLSYSEEEDEQELHALKDEADEDMSSMKPHVWSIPTKRSPQKDSIDNVIHRLENAFIAFSANYSCTYTFPWSKHQEKDGVKDICTVSCRLLTSQDLPQVCKSVAWWDEVCSL